VSLDHYRVMTTTKRFATFLSYRLSDLNGDAFFHAEFGIGHRSTLPEVGVLHSVFAAALSPL
ncbi:hypothetical protein, partial [Pseudomonas syringae group genomosp. 3]|uniref:hypothetical protein n=1 Tax=Pseudomonas syringae group genomosp. 3 TaxID=251701 RepID=UPI001C827EB8